MCINVSPQLVNSVGLVFDIFGVVLLFYFGPPVLKITAEGYEFVWSGVNEIEQERNKKTYANHQRFSRVALGLLLLGFVLQLASNAIQM